MSTRHRYETIAALERLGIGRDDIATLLRASATLSTWAEHECNGAIQRDEATNRPAWYCTHSGKRIGWTSDRETGAVKRAQAIAARYGLTAYHQGDPRGCALYLVRPDDVPAGADIDGYYSRGVAVVPR
jgi:hypothetical protein